MSQPVPTDLGHLRRTVSDGVIRGADLLAAGVSSYAISTRCRPSGPWRRLLPGVVLMSTGPPTRRQWLRAAVAYAGPGSMITGADALLLHGIDVPTPPDVLVLLPGARRAASRSYLTVERTTRLPEPLWHDGLPVAPVVRATTDAARHEPDHDQLLELLLAPLRAGACTVTELLGELATGSQRGTAAPRALLAELARHQYSSGSLPSMSRTWFRAHTGHNQTCPRSAFSTTQASAASGGSAARDRPQREHRTSGSAATAHDATPYLPVDVARYPRSAGNLAAQVNS